MKGKRVLIIGLGSIGKRHFSLLLQRDDIECVHYVSKHTANEHSIGACIFELNSTILSTYDVFIICSETIHHEVQLRHIDSNVTEKTILVEKPLFSKASTYIPNNTVFVTYNLRFHPVIQKLKDLLEGELLLSFSACSGQYLPSWRPNQDYKLSYSTNIERGGGVLRDLSHEIDYALYLCGDLKLISAIANSRSHLKLKSDEVCSILATTENDAHIQIHMDYLSYRPKREIEIQTDNMTISASLILNEINVYYPAGGTDKFVFEGLSRDCTYQNMHEEVLQNSCKKLTNYVEANQIMQVIDNITDKYMDMSWN